jgi:microcompartment protein CcmK/EutM
MVTGTVKDPSLSGHKLLLVNLVDASGTVVTTHQIVVDAVGAGTGDLVLVASGSAARQTATTRGSATDATAVAIIDEITTTD